MGAGKAIVSTPYAYATEMLGDGVGVVVPPASPKALAEALGDLLRHGGRRQELGRRAYERSRSMIWPEVGRKYRAVFARVVAGAREDISGALPRAGSPAVLSPAVLAPEVGEAVPGRVSRAGSGVRAGDD